MPEFTNVDGRQDESRIMALWDLIIDTEKPHPRAVPVVWMRGPCNASEDDPDSIQCFGWLNRVLYHERNGKPYFRINLQDQEDPDTEMQVNHVIYGVYGLGAGEPYTVRVESVEELAFVGWDLRFLSAEEREQVLEDMAA